jgi:hypothetical protein
MFIVEVVIEGVEDHLKMSAVAQKIGVADVYKDRSDIVLTDVLRIGLLDI